VLMGRVEIDPDALHADDIRYFAARIAPPPAVTVAGEQPFLRDALEVLDDAGRIRRGVAPADVAFLAAAAGVETVGARTTVVVVPPAQPVELEAVNRRLATAGIPWRYEAPQAGEARFAAPADDALLRVLDGVRIRHNYPLAGDGVSAGDSVLLRLADGTPWAVRGTRRTGGSYIVLGSTFSADASTLPVGVAMLPLLERLTGAWALAQPPRTDLEAGAAVVAPPGATAMLLPDGVAIDAVPGATVRLGSEQGIYRFVSGDSVIAAYAVNAPAAASDLTRLDRRALEARLPGWDLYVTSDAAAFRRAAFRERVGREIWRPLLLALLAVLMLETLVAAAGRSRRTAPAPADAQAG
jgi:hypothetical protein